MRRLEQTTDAANAADIKVEQPDVAQKLYHKLHLLNNLQQQMDMHTKARNGNSHNNIGANELAHLLYCADSHLNGTFYAMLELNRCVYNNSDNYQDFPFPVRSAAAAVAMDVVPYCSSSTAGTVDSVKPTSSTDGTRSATDEHLHRNLSLLCGAALISDSTTSAGNASGEGDGTSLSGSGSGSGAENGGSTTKKPSAKSRISNKISTNMFDVFSDAAAGGVAGDGSCRRDRNNSDDGSSGSNSVSGGSRSGSNSNSNSNSNHHSDGNNSGSHDSSSRNLSSIDTSTLSLLQKPSEDGVVVSGSGGGSGSGSGSNSNSNSNSSLGDLPDKERSGMKGLHTVSSSGNGDSGSGSNNGLNSSSGNGSVKEESENSSPHDNIDVKGTSAAHPFASIADAQSLMLGSLEDSGSDHNEKFGWLCGTSSDKSSGDDHPELSKKQLKQHEQFQNSENRKQSKQQQTAQQLSQGLSQSLQQHKQQHQEHLQQQDLSASLPVYEQNSSESNGNKSGSDSGFDFPGPSVAHTASRRKSAAATAATSSTIASVKDMATSASRAKVAATAAAAAAQGAPCGPSVNVNSGGKGGSGSVPIWSYSAVFQLSPSVVHLVSKMSTLHVMRTTQLPHSLAKMPRIKQATELLSASLDAVLVSVRQLLRRFGDSETDTNKRPRNSTGDEPFAKGPRGDHSSDTDDEDDNNGGDDFGANPSSSSHSAAARGPPQNRLAANRNAGRNARAVTQSNSNSNSNAVLKPVAGPTDGSLWSPGVADFSERRNTPKARKMESTHLQPHAVLQHQYHRKHEEMLQNMQRQLLEHTFSASSSPGSESSVHDTEDELVVDYSSSSSDSANDESKMDYAGDAAERGDNSVFLERRTNIDSAYSDSDSGSNSSSSCAASALLSLNIRGDENSIVMDHALSTTDSDYDTQSSSFQSSCANSGTPGGGDSVPTISTDRFTLLDRYFRLNEKVTLNDNSLSSSVDGVGELLFRRTATIRESCRPTGNTAADTGSLAETGVGSTISNYSVPSSGSRSGTSTSTHGRGLCNICPSNLVNAGSVPSMQPTIVPSETERGHAFSNPFFAAALNILNQSC
jgi:hypothetical protein